MNQTGPLPKPDAMRGVARCFARSWVMLARGEVHMPPDHLGRTIAFADGSAARVYRETRVARNAVEPCVLVVRFRLRRVRGPWHTAFEKESLLNTPLFVGFPGFTTKLWLAHDGQDFYRGLYDWDGLVAAEQYARSLWRVLELVSVEESIDYRVLPGLTRDELLARPGLADEHVRTEEDSWWRVVHTAAVR